MCSAEAGGTVPVPPIVPFYDGAPLFSRLWPDYKEVVSVVMARGKYSHGLAIQELEHAVQEASGARVAVGVNSGLDAMMLGLKACGVKAGDEVLISACASVDAGMAISALRAVPVFVDVEAGTLDIDVGMAEGLVSEHTAAVIVSNPIARNGIPYGIEHLAERIGFHIVEDLAGSFGRFAESSKFAAVSMSPQATIGALGDAGILLTNDLELAATTSMLRHHGRTGETIGRMPGVSNRAEICGTNSKMDDFLAAYARLRLERLDVELEELRQCLLCYIDSLGDAVDARQISLCASTGAGENPGLNSLIIRTPEKEPLKRFLIQSGVQVRDALFMPLTKQPCFAHHSRMFGDYPCSEAFSAEALTLPFYSGLTKEQIHYVGSRIRKFFEL